jgi:hypothetical protein
MGCRAIFLTQKQSRILRTYCMHGGGVTLYSMYNLEPDEKVRKKGYS